MSMIQIVDRGRGPQLSTSRITVLDLLPYFQQGCSYDEILRWLPSLSREEVAIVECYYHEHKQAVDELDRRSHEYFQQRIQEQRDRLPQLSPDQRLARLKGALLTLRQEKNGAGHSG